MVRTETNSQTINNLYKKNVNPKMIFLKVIKLIYHHFFRGDEDLKQTKRRIY